ncbi:proton-conducting transporter transmembrane domain-containing protein [Thalassiella azotivora]
MTAALALLVLLPALGGALLLLAGHRADRVAGGVAVGVAAVCVPLAVAVAVGRPALTARYLALVDGGHLGLAVDGLSAVMVTTVSAVGLAVLVFALADMAEDAARARFSGFMLLFLGAMLVTVTATTLPTLLLSWEVMGATSYALIALRWREAATVPAATTAFLTTRAGDLGLYVAAGAALAGAGTLSLDGVERATGGWLHVAAAGVLVTALGKSAQLPFSAWLSAAMHGPSAVSALLHSATMVAAGGYLLLRLEPLLREAGWAAPVTAWAGALTALVLGAVALAQSDLKQLLAASTAAQIGFVVLAAGVGGTAGGTAHLVAHAAVKAALFVVAGAWLGAFGTKRLAALRGAARRTPGTGAAFVVAALSLGGLPPLALWATKDEVLASVDDVGLRLVALAAAALSAAYAAKLLAVATAPASHAEPLDDERRGTRRVPRTSTAVAAVLAGAAVALAAVALPPVAAWTKRLLGVPAEASPAPAELVLSGVLALAVTATVLARPGALARLEGTVLHGWLGLPGLLSGSPAPVLARWARWCDEAVVDRVVTAVPASVRAGAAVLSRVGERGLDGVVTGAARGAEALARAVTSVDVGRVDGAVRSLARGLGAAGSAARRPQTGLLHQYYAMSVAGLGLLLLLLLVGR